MTAKVRGRFLFIYTHSHMLEDVTLHTSHRCTFSSPVGIFCQVWDIMHIIPQESWVRNTFRDRIKLQLNKTKKEALSRRSQCGITMQYVQQLSTAVWGSGCLECSGLSIPCKLGQKTLKFLPMPLYPPHPHPTLPLSVTCLFLPLQSYKQLQYNQK